MIFIITAFGILIMLATFLILSIIQLFVPFNYFVLNNILFSICVVVAIISNLNYFNRTGNKSSGAYDNAAAVGTIIELARFYKNKPKDNVDLIFLCTSSEELNLGGAKDFIQKYKNKFDKSSTYFINLDLIGGNEMIRLITSYGIPRKVSSQKLKDLFFRSAKELKIDIKDIYVPTGAWSDYMPIVQEGFEACWISSQPGLKCVHTKKDNMNLVSKEGLKNVLLLCESVVDKINNI
jgi:Zn-dependent M28 family amino/carboxypeptidase